MNGDAHTDFTALDQYQPERYVAPAAVSPSAPGEAEEPEPFLDEPLHPDEGTPSRYLTAPPKAPKVMTATTAEPISVERRRRWSIRRVSWQLAAAVLVVQAGVILVMIARRQPGADSSPRRIVALAHVIEPLAHARDLLQSSRQVLTARADDHVAPPDRRDPRPDAKPAERTSNRSADVKASKAPRASSSAATNVQRSPAVNRVANATTTPRTDATLDRPAASDEVPPESAASQAPANTPAEVTPPTPIPVESVAAQQPAVRDAELLSYVRPTYPDVARQSGITGGVEIDMTIDTSGRVVRSLAVSGPRLLRGASESALRQWRFRPASVDGAPVASRRRYLVSFSAPSPDAPYGSVLMSEPRDP
jgi:outer membrane biosynthesis protein TonB